MLAIAGGKGGCGKTTTALGLAIGLARAGRSPLVADADRQLPDLDVLADVPSGPGLAALAEGARPTVVGHRLPAEPGVTVVPAGGVGGDGLTVGLQRAATWDGPVIVDSPAGAGRDAARPLRVADRSLLVTTPTRQAVEDTVKTAVMARTLSAPPVGAIVVECYGRGERGGGRVPLDRLAAALECQILERIPDGGSDALGSERVRLAYADLARKVKERNI
jgi:septum site-determining protein MinD